MSFMAESHLLTEPRPDGYAYICLRCAERHGPPALGPRVLEFKDCEACSDIRQKIRILPDRDKPLRDKR